MCLYYMHSVIGSARIKCGQKGREYTASLKNLTNKDGTHAEEDLVKGKEWMWEVKGKSYPVNFLHIYVKGTFGFTRTCVNFYIVTVQWKRELMPQFTFLEFLYQE